MKLKLINSKKKFKVSKSDYDFIHFVGPWKLSAGRPYSKQFQVFAQELVLGGLTVDNIKHKNGDSLDCRRRNLRPR